MKCAFCRDEKEEKDLVPVDDKETMREILICNSCDYLLGIIGIGYDEEQAKEELNPIVVKN